MILELKETERQHAINTLNEQYDLAVSLDSWSDYVQGLQPQRATKQFGIFS
ncbi:MAG: hypothetical protein JNL32_04700 [Candidatus Kapabacteria bacterium]|nr:hypothetical protein [Candidatus Kapabacteria bacterium]